MTTKLNKYNIALIGAGTNTKEKHIPGLLKIPEVTIQGIGNRSEESSRRAAALIPADRFTGKIYHHWQEPLHDPEVDAVVIGTPPAMHYPLVKACLLAGKHVLTEARFCLNATQAWELYQLGLGHPELVTQIVPAPFTFGLDDKLIELCQPQSLGDVQFVELRSMTGSGVSRPALMTFRENKAESGFNTMFLGIWYESLLRWLGPVTEVNASGRIENKRLFDEASQQWVAAEIPDHLQVNGKLACGGQLSMILSHNCHLPKNEYLIRIHGSKLSIQAWPMENRLQVYKPGETGDWTDVDPGVAVGWRVEEEFIRAIQCREKVKYTTFLDGWRYMHFTESVMRSYGNNGQNIPLL